MGWTYEHGTAWHTSDVVIPIEGGEGGEWLVARYTVDCEGEPMEEGYQLLHIVDEEAHFCCDSQDPECPPKCFSCKAYIPDHIFGFLSLCDWTLR